MKINHNMSSINAHRVLKFRGWELDKSVARLATGERINSARDDASGLAVSEKMRTQIMGLRRAERNTEDGLSFIQTADGFLSQVADVLQRVRVLSVQSANGIYHQSDRLLMQVEVSQLIDEIDRIASQAEFNRFKILLGDYAPGSKVGSMWFHVGANMNQRERAYISTMTSKALGINNARLTTVAESNEAIGLVDNALEMIFKERANLGGYANRLETIARGLMNAYENAQAAESQIRDADMAETIVEYTRNQILETVATSMLAQSNLRGRGILRLLGF